MAVAGSMPVRGIIAISKSLKTRTTNMDPKMAPWMLPTPPMRITPTQRREKNHS